MMREPSVPTWSLNFIQQTMRSQEPVSKRDWCLKVNFRETKKEREGACQKEKQREPVLGKRLNYHIFLMTTLRVVVFSSLCREEEWRTKARGLRPGSCDFSVYAEQCVRGISKLENMRVCIRACACLPGGPQSLPLLSSFLLISS